MGVGCGRWVCVGWVDGMTVAYNSKMATTQSDTFFPTQITQDLPQPHTLTTQSAQKSEEESPQQAPTSSHEAEGGSNQSSPSRESMGKESGVKELLTLFNSFDREEKGMITTQEARSILEGRGIPTDKFQVHYKVATPEHSGFISFDQFLFVYGLCEDESVEVDSKYQLCTKIDPRLLQFLRLLNGYRKKTEAMANYKQAKKSKIKIEEIRMRELERRKKFLSIIHQHQLSLLEQTQHQKLEQFCGGWDQFMVDYEKTAADLIDKLNQKQSAELGEFQTRTREELRGKIKFSKQVIELESKQKVLVKLQQYEQALKVQHQIEDLKLEELFRKQKTIEESVDARCANLRKQQLSAVNSLLQNIQKDRNDQLRQRKSDSEKLMVRNKNLMQEINHRHVEALKKIHDVFHNISLDVEKVKALRKN